MAFYGTGFGMPAPTVVGGFPSYGAPMGAPIAYGAPSFGGQIVDGSDAG
eukprot:CAMPEP_0175916542 /NCGR_PEP_ID=MMETSP0108-20121206/10903_1 /TAXON_ID=195067 ORGANISM="Goniomonas pacifica, Strain CCMP1869" /NCGR_SAMPLE_ID=MMETSP0108 /ASSEMBLY_ACC=CAM_ASM_000204 /LENGTH=48 /DNA_ID= /DNA_START= /DNA_END= /DNA_ORIENTATION=